MFRWLEIKQKKIIDCTNSCVEICDISEYQYEYNGKCYENFKNGVLISDTDLTTKECKCELEQSLLCPQVSLNKNLCTKCNYNYYKKENDLFNIGEYINCFKDPEGYYLDLKDSLYKKCFYSCKSCEIEGNNITHNYLLCNREFPIELNFNNTYLNCYPNCSYYYYVDNNNNFFALLMSHVQMTILN